MHTRCWLGLIGLLLFAWQWSATASEWEDAASLEHRDGRALLVLLAQPERELSARTQAAVETAWERVQPAARRVRLEHWLPLLGRESALALCVFAADGSLVARHDGPIDADAAEEWLRLALATSDAECTAIALHDAQLFERAELALRLGDEERAGEYFEELARDGEAQLRAPARERLARLALSSGAVARARSLIADIDREDLDPRWAARLDLCRGLIQFAEREQRAACASLAGAARELQRLADSEAENAQFALARAQHACGETSLALRTLEALVRSSKSLTVRGSARTFAEQIQLPPTQDAH